MKRWLPLVCLLVLFGASPQTTAAQQRGVLTGIKCDFKAFAQDGEYQPQPQRGEPVPLEVSYGVSASACSPGAGFDVIRSRISSDVPGDRGNRKRTERMPHRNFNRLVDPPPGQYSAQMAIHIELRGSRKWAKPTREACALQNRRTELNCAFERSFEITIQQP